MTRNTVVKIDLILHATEDFQKIVESINELFGIEKEENIPMVFDLANALGAEISASRPVVDSGWMESFRQVGSSGQTVAPKLYFSLGISGAIQHVVGMKGSKNILSINKDPDAPIFQKCDYGICGDLFEVIPALTEEFKKLS